MQQSVHANRRAWGGVYALALSAFIFNTSEFVPVGLLSDIASSFDMRVTQVGLMLTIYAWVVALASLPLMLLTRRIERRHLLMGTLVLFIAAHVVCGFANSFPLLIAGRIGIAFSHAVFWSITASLAVRIAPPGKQAQALGLLAAGTSIAMVLGIPTGRVIGDLIGWRITFLSIGAVAALVMIALRLLLPPLPSQKVGSLASLPILFRRKVLIGLYLLTIAVVTGHFTAYSYIEPFSQTVARLTARETTILLLVFGGMGIPATILFGRWYARRSNVMFVGSIALVAACLFALATAAVSEYWMLVTLCGVWGMAILVFGLAMQARVLERAPEATDVAMSIYSGIYNIGIGGGALLGSQVSDRLSLRDVGIVGSAMTIIGLLISFWIVRRRPDVGMPVAPGVPRPHADAPPGIWRRWRERHETAPR
ncbi:sugar transporter [Stenotrophomonas sp. MMGLT7]|uniref:sugar transporter n=1 Tax=Stenotrophomonas sp. MMGLT7 TaxID=2901227 RepID=UPI001E396247|nr:sugar transporter [Stenotrophomonas sp. MMGLT7]MCD7097696.1 sugar transporter [Stenotrophomonas sp. MMGLT7]